MKKLLKILVALFFLVGVLAASPWLLASFLCFCVAVKLYGADVFPEMKVHFNLTHVDDGKNDVYVNLKRLGQ